MISRSCASSRSGCRRRSERGHRRLPGAGRQPGVRARTRLPRVSGRPAGGHHRAALPRGYRPVGPDRRRGAGRPACRSPAEGDPMTAATDFAQTAQQRETATTIFERGAPGRRASCRPRSTSPRSRSTCCCQRDSGAAAARACPRSRNRRSSATTCASCSATSIWIPGSTRSARAR